MKKNLIYSFKWLVLFFVLSSLGTTCVLAGSRGSLNSLENILKEAGDLKTFLNSTELKDKYYAELVLYMGEESNFRSSYDEILNQLETITTKYPEIIPRFWNELPIQILNLRPTGSHWSRHSQFRVRSLPRLFHSFFKGINAHEPTGGHNPIYFGIGTPDARGKISSLTPLRWASSLVEGSQFYHVEEVEKPGQVSHLESYKGFIQITPGEINGEMFGALEISSMELVLTDNSNEEDSALNRCIQELYRRIPKTWKGLIVSNARLNLKEEEINSLSEFRSRNFHYIFGKSADSPNQYFKIDDSLVSKLAEFKYAANVRTGGLYVWSDQLIIQATITQVAIDGEERYSPYLKDLTILNPKLTQLKDSYTLTEILEMNEKATHSSREEGLLKVLLPRMSNTPEAERALLLNAFTNKKMSPQALLTIYSARGINDLTKEEVKILMSLEGIHQERYSNFVLPDIKKVLDGKRMLPIAELSFYLASIYQDVYNLKMPVKNWLKKIERINNYKALLLFQGLNQSFEISLAAARALQLTNSIQTPPVADLFVAEALKHGIDEIDGDQFLIVNLSYLEKLMADYIRSSKINSSSALINNIIKYGLSNLSLSDRIAVASIEFLSQKELKLDQKQKDLILEVRQKIALEKAHPLIKKERMKKIDEILEVQSLAHVENKTCAQLMADIIQL